MIAAHVLRKYNPAEWGGTETALHRLFQGLAPEGVQPLVFYPRLDDAQPPARDPLGEIGCSMRTFKACVPVWGMPAEQKRQWRSVGGNLMSFDLPWKLLRAPDLALVHSHTLGRIGALARAVARRRGIPFVVTLHGGVMALPQALQRSFATPAKGLEWGKLFGWILRARGLLAAADTIFTCNPQEAELLKKQLPDARVQCQPHGIPLAFFEQDRREDALAAFPQLRGRRYLLSVGRIDPVKNQGWLAAQMPALRERLPGLMLVLAGSCTDQEYGANLIRRIQQLGVESALVLTGGLPPDDPRLAGLYQGAEAVVLPSTSEAFGLVILEAWAAGKPPIASRTPGAVALVQHGANGMLFDLQDPGTFLAAATHVLQDAKRSSILASEGRRLLETEYDSRVLAQRVKRCYEQLIEEHRALHHHPRR